MTYPELELSPLHQKKVEKLIARRAKGEPIAYITRHKEFYGLDFIVDKNTLIPRPETELLVEQAIQETRNPPTGEAGTKQETNIIDVGTGSGNIIISIAKSIEHGAWSIKQGRKIKFFGTDISIGALAIAKQNAKAHCVDKKIKFLQGNLIEPILKKCSMLHAPCSMIITANLPYLSKEIYRSAPIDVKKYEPRSALYSPQSGLAHYHRLLKQLKKNIVPCSMFHVLCLLEISPEQKKPLAKIIRGIFPAAKTEFAKDLAGKWRVCKIKL